MSGTSYGACILHVAPEAFVGGPLALVRTGDIITLGVPARTLKLDIPEAEFAARQAAWTSPAPHYHQGYGWIYSQHVQQANQGCDFDFLRTEFGPATGEPSIYWLWELLFTAKRRVPSQHAGLVVSTAHNCGREPVGLILCEHISGHLVYSFYWRTATLLSPCHFGRGTAESSMRVNSC